MTRHWASLPNIPKYADLQQKLRAIESAPQHARERTVAMLEDMVKDFTKEDLDLFTRKVILDDLSWDAANERDLPFGFTPETLIREKQKVDAAVMADPDKKVWTAAMKRKLANRKVAQELVEAGVLDPAASQIIGLVVETRCAYFAPIAFPDRIEVGVKVVHLGTSSVRYDVGIFRGDAEITSPITPAAVSAGYRSWRDCVKALFRRAFRENFAGAGCARSRYGGRR